MPGICALKLPSASVCDRQQQAPGWHMDWEIPSAEGPRLTAGRGLTFWVSCLICWAHDGTAADTELGLSTQEAERLAALGDDGEATPWWSVQRPKEGWWVGMLAWRVDSEMMEHSLEVGTSRADKKLPHRAAWQVKSRHEEEGMTLKV